MVNNGVSRLIGREIPPHCHVPRSFTRTGLVAVLQWLQQRHSLFCEWTTVGCFGGCRRRAGRDGHARRRMPGGGTVTWCVSGKTHFRNQKSGHIQRIVPANVRRSGRLPRSRGAARSHGSSAARDCPFGVFHRVLNRISNAMSRSWRFFTRTPHSPIPTTSVAFNDQMETDLA
jgi:hypothetical protein